MNPKKGSWPLFRKGSRPLLVAIAVLGVVCTSFAADVVTPDDPAYDAKLTRERTQLKKAVLPAQRLQARLTAATERLAELEAVVNGKKTDYIPQLLAAYKAHLNDCVKVLEMPPDMRTLDEKEWRTVVTMISPHSNRLALLEGKMDEAHRESVRESAALAEQIQEQCVEEWKDAPEPTIPSTTPAVNVRIDVKMTDIGRNEKTWAGINWKYSGKKVKAKSTGNIASKNGLRVGVGSGNVKIVAGAGVEQTTRDSMTNQFIVVMSGLAATIDLRTEYTEPVPIMIFRPGDDAEWFTESYRLVRAGALLQVRPTVIPGGMIMVELTPVFSHYERGKQLLKLAKLSTTVLVGNGQSIVIGGLNTAENTVGKALFGGSGSTGAANKVITLTPRIQKPMIILPTDD